MKHALGLCTIWLSSPSPWSHWPLLTCPCSQPGHDRKQLRPLKERWIRSLMHVFHASTRWTCFKQVWTLSCNDIADQTINTGCDETGKLQLVGICRWVSPSGAIYSSRWTVWRQKLSMVLWVPCHRKSTATAWTLSKPASKGVELTRLSSTESRTQCNVCSFFLFMWI